MPLLGGYVTEEQDKEIDELIEQGQYEDRSHFLQKAVQRQLYNKHNIDAEPANDKWD